MPERCRQRLEDKNAVWVAGLRQLLAADGTSQSHLATPLEFLISQPELFYHSRNEIAPLAMSYLNEVAPPSNPAHQCRKLGLRLMRLFSAWEHRRINSRSIWSVYWGRDGANQSLTPRMIEYVVELFIQLPHRKFPSAKFAEKMPPAVMKQPPPEDFYDGAMARASLATTDNVQVGKHIDSIINALQASCILVHFRSKSWITKYMAGIQEVFEPCFISERPEIQEQLRAAQECGIFKEIQRIVASRSFTESIKEKAEEGGNSSKARGFVEFFLGLIWPWMKPTKLEGRSQRLQTTSGEKLYMSEKLPIRG
ncbi:hypothetical protein JX266_014358 [Neoarthrinium moseri]|nr:hypothetical protein JX266_014358 [Neoarthrinium moseri]